MKREELIHSSLKTNPLYNEYYDYKFCSAAGRVRVSEEFEYCGHSGKLGGPKGPSHPPDDWDTTTVIFPEVKIYNKPDRGPDLEKQYLKTLYSYQRRDETEIAKYYLMEAQVDLFSQVPLCHPPSWVDNLPLPLDVLSSINNMKSHANAGYPFCKSNKGKKEFAFENFEHVYHLVLIRILALEFLFQDTDHPTDLVRKFCVDPVMAMIKNEIIKIGKDPRMIGMTSVVSELVYRVMFDESSNQDVISWGEFYSCIGIGFTVEASDVLHEYFGSTPIAKSDVPKFDTSRTMFEAVLDNHLNMYQLGIQPTHRIFRIYHNFTLAGCFSVFVFTDGEMWCQLFPGVTKSGEKVTGKRNTETRARRSYAVARFMGKDDNKCRNAGDDAIESHYPGKQEAYHALGFPLRDYEIVTGDIDFCSHYFPKGKRPIGQRIIKAAAGLLYTRETSSERLSSFVREFANHPEFSDILSKIFAARPKINLF